MINGFFAVEKNRPMHTGGRTVLNHRGNDKRMVHSLAKLESKLEYSFTNPSYRQISAKPHVDQIPHQRRTFRSQNSPSPQRSAR